MQSLLKIIIFTSIIIGLLADQAHAANTNAESLSGKWNIVQTNGNVLDSIDITITVSSKSFSRFDFKQLSQNGDNPGTYQGILFEDYIVFNLINLGYTQTYIAQIDFDLGGGAGVQISSALANCTTVGKDNSLVDKKNRKRLSDNSARCDGTSLNDSVTSNIKIVKDGISANTIPDAGAADPSLVANQDKISERLTGVWNIPGQKAQKKKLLIKEPVADFLGYQFTYKVVNNTTKLINLSESDFLTGTRKGYFIDNYLLLNTSEFKKNDELFIFKLSKTKGSGREFKIKNGDCFALKNPVSGTFVCTPNIDTERVNNNTTRFDGKKISKSNTNIIINF